MIPLGWSGWDQERVMLSTVRLTWCIIDTVDGAVKRQKQSLLTMKQINDHQLHSNAKSILQDLWSRGLTLGSAKVQGYNIYSI